MSDPRTDEQLLGIVAAFVLRARRILAHSLCADKNGLAHLADGAWYAIRKEGQESIRRVLPNEEALESLAARVRPLILLQDPVRYDHVLNALSAYLHRHGHSQHVQWCKELKKDWKTVDLATGEAGYFVSVTTDGFDEPPVEISDLGLAGTWFYGDLLHADHAQTDKGKAFEIDQRYAAAAVRVAQLAILAQDTLSFVRSLIEEGAIEISDEALESLPVKVELTNLQLLGVYMAPVGTEVPGPAGTPLGEAWQGGFPGHEDGQWIMRIPWGRSDG